jgi:hypothetical protein
MTRGSIRPVVVALLAWLLCGVPAVASDQRLSASLFQDPPKQYRPWTVWWWFGNATPTAELVHELEEMDRNGIGGVEINPVYTLDGADPKSGLAPVEMYSPGWNEKFRAVAKAAERLGMKVVLRGGSGWPYGGPWITASESAAAVARGVADLRIDQKAGENGPKSLDIPAPRPEPYSDWKVEGLEAAAAWNRASREVRPLEIQDDRVHGALPVGEWQITAAWRMRTGQTVKRSAPGGDGLVLDHFRGPSLDLQLRPLGQALAGAQAVAPHALAGVTSDSLELDDSNWTPGFLDEFARRKGYRLEAYLPHLWNEIDVRTAGVRQDYLEVLGRLQVENYAGRLTAWCEKRGLKSYIQAHGSLADALEAYGAASVPEGETIWPGKERLEVNVRNRRIAASAGDIYGKPVSMAESYTWLRMPRFLVRLDQLKAASDAIVLDGIRHIKNHGFPSSPRQLGKPGWVFYASTMINPNQTWWPHYHALSKYVARLNYLMQAGERVSDVAIYSGVADSRAHYYQPAAKWLGEDDAWHRPGRDPGLDTSARVAERVNDLAQLLYQRGYGFDIAGDDAFQNQLSVTGGRLTGKSRVYRAVVLVRPESVPLPVLRRLADFVKAGGIVICIGRVPSRGTGLGGEKQAGEVAVLAGGMTVVHDEEEAERILRDQGMQDFVVRPAPGRPLASELDPALDGSGTSSPLRAIHRRAGDVDYYFVANGDRENREFQVAFRDSRGRKAQLWDPMSGELRAWDGPQLALGPWGSVALVFGLGPAKPAPSPEWSEPAAVTDAWQVKTDGTANYSASWTSLHDWLEVPELKSFAGLGIYRKSLEAPRVAAMARICLGRVEQSAEVRVNGREAGVVFLPPYCVDTTVHAGTNTLEVRVANTWSNAVSAMAPQPSKVPGPGYGITDVLYGNAVRRPQSGGLLGPVTVQFR